MTDANTGPRQKQHRLWGGRFEGGEGEGESGHGSSGPAADFEALNNSIGVDFRLWPFDVELSKAWAAGLQQAGVLTSAEAQSIDRGLDAVATRLREGEKPIASDEDVHTLIDRLLHEEIGEPASKLHTGRSRNDQVATATRLWVMNAADRLQTAVLQVQRVILTKAHEGKSALMPSYTHMQRAIPVSAAHWLLSHFWPLERDRQRFVSARRAAGTLPLGSGAAAGSAYPIPRALLAERLRFTTISQNSMDAVSDRDFVAELLFACTLLATHLSRFAEDLIIYGSAEFSFVRFGDAYTSGSSMMPQKRNPDALELTRGSAARMLGDLVSLLATMKGLPSTYNKDMQDDKRPLFDAVDTLLLVLPSFAGALAESSLRPDRMRAALTSAMMATDLADYLVRRGATFREAHAAVGRLVRIAEDSGQELTSLPSSTYQAQHKLFGADVTEALSPENSVLQRNIGGGTGPDAVRSQLAEAEKAIKAV